ncbi:MAG: SDR family oxidoreductase [Solirubrobacterales bacterium]|nr:SDR family oxidoreductase [Solirubrobacterales bacterium]
MSGAALGGLAVAVAGAATPLRAALADGLAAAGARAVAVDAAGSPAQAATLAEAARTALGGPVGALVCAPPPLTAATFAELAPAELDAAVAAAYRAPLLQTQALLADLRAGGGRVVYVTSATAILARAATAHVAAGARAVVALMRTLAAEEGPAVAANAIGCGPLAGDALHQARVRGLRAQRGLDTAAAEAALAAALPLGRLAEPADVAATAAWLLGPAAAGITGQVLAVAGGGELQVWP